jgi:hypothetical protein
VNCDAGRRPLGLVAMAFTRDFSAAQSAGSRQIRQAFLLPTFIATRQSDTSPPSRLTWCVLQVSHKFLPRLTAIAGLTHHKLFTSSLLSHCFQSPLRLRKSVHNSSSSSIENLSSLVVVSWATKKDWVGLLQPRIDLYRKVQVTTCYFFYCPTCNCCYTQCDVITAA